MKINFPKRTKTLIKEERDKIFLKMRDEDDPDIWEQLNMKYSVYNAMLKPTWEIKPDTILLVAANLVGIVLILNFEKVDIVRSRAMNFVLKGRV